MELLDLAYKHEPQRTTVAPGESATLVFDGKQSFGWYDLKVVVADNEQFVKRYAGRVETGLAGISDPAMAGRYNVTHLPTYVVEENGVEVERTGSVSVLGTILIAFLVWLIL